MTEVVAGLAKNNPRDVELEDDTGDVSYTVRTESDTGLTRIHLLNTDWSNAGNEKRCRMRSIVVPSSLASSARYL